ncbi:hypothetical protein BS47DRAFT_1365780 [Hydnum rufescens UP504]|uniref:Uncharacterized protein n=1 Tax=Hydnum rufescens UP504 TaxID=1448309 RepID=A0A9P6ANU5_9AGAM|nr:hypothetical protein BS47DRAFT_1365780 [Hydnum rufescens UP504]
MHWETLRMGLDLMVLMTLRILIGVSNARYRVHYQLELAHLALDDPPDNFDDEIYDDDWPPFQCRMEANPGLPPEPISDSGDDGLGEEDLDIMDDPVFIDNSNVYECKDVLERQQAVQDLDTSPEAFNEAPEIWNAYIHAFVMAYFDHCPHTAINAFLSGQRALFQTMAIRHNCDIVGLEDMALTLPTVERRLGISTAPFVAYYMMCKTCWKRHELQDLYELDSALCMREGCSGILWTSKLLAGGQEKRTPMRLFSYAPIIPALQRILLCPGKYDLMQHWRREGDEVGAAPPISEEMDGVGALPLQGWKDGGQGPQESKTWTFTIYISALFRVTSWGHTHLAGAIYIMICNLPRGIRFLWEETILLATVPGPREPSLEQLNEVIEPFVREMFLLEQGLPFKVHSFQHEQIIHAKLWFNASDLPASRKFVGNASHSKPGHFCSFCNKDSSCLSDASGFDPDSMGVVMEIVGSMAHDPFLAFVHQDESKQTQYAFFSRWATTASARERLFNKNGKQFSALNALPQWGYSCSPVDLMHSAFLGLIPHIFKSLLHGGEWLATVIWPHGVGRIPKDILAGGRIKADQWQNYVAIAPLHLFMAWQENGRIPDHLADQPPPSSSIAQGIDHLEALFHDNHRKFLGLTIWAVTEDFLTLGDIKMDRNYYRHYENILKMQPGQPSSVPKIGPKMSHRMGLVRVTKPGAPMRASPPIRLNQL